MITELNDLFRKKEATIKINGKTTVLKIGKESYFWIDGKYDGWEMNLEDLNLNIKDLSIK